MKRLLKPWILIDIGSVLLAYHFGGGIGAGIWAVSNMLGFIQGYMQIGDGQ